MKPRILLAALPVALAVISCSDATRPSDSAIEESLAGSLPAFLRVSTFSVEARENLGTNVEPEWQSRFRATVKVTTPTYVVDGDDGSVTFIRLVKREGESVEVFGTSTSQLYAGTWRTTVSVQGRPFDGLGRPEADAARGRVIVRGSKAETEYLAEVARLAAQEARLAEQAALQRQEALERREALIATARARAKPMGEVECVADGRRQRFRWVITSAGLNWEVVQIREDGGTAWTTAPQGSQGAIWFDQLSEPPTYGRGYGSTADRTIHLATDGGRFAVYCVKDGVGAPADYLEETHTLLLQAIDSWKAEYPELVRW